MVVILLIDKLGSIKEQKIKTFDKTEFYKKCAFRKPTDFDQRTVWKNMKVGSDLVNVMLYAKNNGIARTENKYDLPPPVDTTLYFGTMLLAAEDAELNTPYDLTISMWNKIYEKLFGGFEDLTKTDDEEEEDELDNIPDEMKTKNGYLKDGFVVEDNILSPPLTTEDEESAEETETETDSHNSELDENFDSELECEEYEYENQ